MIFLSNSSFMLHVVWTAFVSMCASAQPVLWTHGSDPTPPPLIPFPLFEPD